MYNITRGAVKSHPFRTILLITWLTLVFSMPDSFQIISDYFAFLFIGITGAIFANSTGAGGGVVFVPFFNQLKIDNSAIIATSFAIQCCGMTAGAITWHKYRLQLKTENGKEHSQWQFLNRGLAITVPFSIFGILVAQFLLGSYTVQAQTSLHLGFGIFSILLAIAIYASIPLLSRTKVTLSFVKTDFVILSALAFFGGIITAWLSVGVGELVAVYLILRGFNIACSIALAVILSAFSVWSAIYYHLTVSHAIYWEVLLFAGAGAIVGGIIAKRVVLYFPVIKLKVFFATWVLIMGIAGLFT